jgi:competence protein ComEA
MTTFNIHAVNTRRFKTFISTIALSLALAGSALAAEKVNINTADAATLDRVLLNVGPSKAQAIVDYRKQNGAFRSAEQLAQVQGIGLKTVEKNRDLIMIGGAAPSAKPTAAKAPTATPKAR